VPVNCPDGFPEAAKAVWASLSPFALEAGTLTPGTARAFALLCRCIVLEEELALTEPGGANHRGLIQRVAAGSKDFLVSPIGRPIAKPEEVVDPFAKFVAV